MKGLAKATLIRRYKRFLADVYLDDEQRITVHCPNTGSMKNCVEEGATVWLSRSENPKRKYQYTWEYMQTSRGHYIGINTNRANQLVKEGIESGVVTELRTYPDIKTEVKYGQENSRIDILLSGSGLPDCYVEVKSVTLLEEAATKGSGYFPDAISERGSKHLRELALVAQSGCRAVLIFCVQHSGIQRVFSADHIDKAYGDTLRMAIDSGVEVLAYKVRFGRSRLKLWRPVPFHVSPI
ncbi:MAG TPA: DNA/RNA nuclease SfsA [Gammaproteobacteria bacterium]|nr:DNA/RNA nuclease SfsA [Gammaproteobacteria bacterium]|tara:strand:- start:1112 stop:1828 length:717 start_codon:yes stop_codon:yes gene_type:complete